MTTFEVDSTPQFFVHEDQRFMTVQSDRFDRLSDDRWFSRIGDERHFVAQYAYAEVPREEGQRTFYRVTDYPRFERQRAPW